MPFFAKKLPGPDGWIIPGTKMTNTVPLLWNNSSKIQIFTDILYTFCRRLLRPADVTFLKTKNVYQKFIISAFQNYFQTRFYLHISICQSQFIKSSSMWYTLYIQIANVVSQWWCSHGGYQSFCKYVCIPFLKNIFMKNTRTCCERLLAAPSLMMTHMVYVYMLAKKLKYWNHFSQGFQGAGFGRLNGCI